MFSWDGTLPVGTPAGLVRAGEEVDGQWEPGMICYGIPAGTDGNVQHKLEEMEFSLILSASKDWQFFCNDFHIFFHNLS